MQSVFWGNVWRRGEAANRTNFKHLKRFRLQLKTQKRACLFAILGIVISVELDAIRITAMLSQIFIKRLN